MKVEEHGFGRMLSIFNNNNLEVQIAIFKKSGKPHAHPKYEICFVMDGDCWVYIDKDRYYVGPGDVIIIPPGCKHWMKPDGICKMVLAYDDKSLTLQNWGPTKHRFIRHRAA